MKKYNFNNIAKYIWSGSLFSCSDAKGVSGGLVLLWNANKINGSEIFHCRSSVGVMFSYPSGSLSLINLYALN